MLNIWSVQKNMEIHLEKIKTNGVMGNDFLSYFLHYISNTSQGKHV